MKKQNFFDYKFEKGAEEYIFNEIKKISENQYLNEFNYTRAWQKNWEEILKNNEELLLERFDFAGFENSRDVWLFERNLGIATLRDSILNHPDKDILSSKFRMTDDDFPCDSRISFVFDDYAGNSHLALELHTGDLQHDAPSEIIVLHLDKEEPVSEGYYYYEMDTALSEAANSAEEYDYQPIKNSIARNREKKSKIKI